jgi:CheY-like chemotaxis protein
MEARKVLIVDDEQDVLQHLSSILSSSGFEVIATERGTEALKLAAEKKPDIIILDVNLPDMDGGEVASRLSQNSLTSAIPIVYLTGLVTKKEHKEPQKIGKSFVIAKPVLKGELISTITRVFQK